MVDSLVQQLGVNGVVVCDCGHRKFMIGVKADALGNSFIRLLECGDCGKEMAVPWQSFVENPPGPVVDKGNVKFN